MQSLRTTSPEVRPPPRLWGRGRNQRRRNTPRNANRLVTGNQAGTPCGHQTPGTEGAARVPLSRGQGTANQVTRSLEGENDVLRQTHPWPPHKSPIKQGLRRPPRQTPGHRRTGPRLKKVPGAVPTGSQPGCPPYQESRPLRV